MSEQEQEKKNKKVQETNNYLEKRITYSSVNNDNSVAFKSFIFGALGGVLVFLVLTLVTFEKDNPVDIKDNNSSNNNSIVTNIVKYENPIPSVATAVGPCVVGVTVQYDYYSFFGTQQAKQEGSGIIISSDGYIITNNHVVDTNASLGEKIVEVYLSNSTEPIEAEIIGTDRTTDIAILKIDCTDLPAIKLGSSTDLSVGDLAIAIGNPLGMNFAGSVTVGYVSALNREVSDTNGNKHVLIQTDAAINEGNSGGALVNVNGELIGINMAKIGGTGIEGLGFAIPIDSVKDVINDLIEYKKVIRPYVGIVGINVDEATKKKYDLDAVGIYIQTVETFSAAEIAGLKVGDIIVKINNQKVTSMEEFNKIKNQHKVGDVLTITVVRNDKEVVVDLTLKAE